MRTSHIILIALISILCNCRPAGDDNTEKLTSQISDTLDYQDVLANLYKDRLAKELNIERLKIGVDSFELRFHAAIGVLKCGLRQMIVLKKKDNVWSCLEYQYILHNVPFGSDDVDYATKFTIDTIRIFKHKPVSGWTNFISALERENIYDLPSQVDIASWDSLNVVIADGTSYSVEFANNERYRHYSYNTPQEFVKYFKECRNMSNIIEIFDKEIGVKDKVDEIIKTCDEIKKQKTPEHLYK